MGKLLWLKGYASRFLRRGLLFHKLLRELEQNEKASPEKIIEYQNKMLRLSVENAYKQVPYYKKLFDRLQIKPQAIKTIEDLQLLPILKKDAVRGHEEKFVSPSVKFKFKAYTSGTTGTPLNLFRDRFSVNLENAAIWRQRRWADFGLNDRRATLRGDLVTPVDGAEPPFWQFNPGENQLLMSSYHLSDKFIPYYLDKLREFQPAAIEAYPSSVYRLARYMQINQEQPIRVKAVFTSSEMLFDYQREVIEQYFGKVFDYYGNAERVAFICMCEFGNYHYAMDYSIVEFIPAEDGLCQIVGTTLHNSAMPFIRYATGDLAQMSHENCPCNRPFPIVKKLEGRRDDYVITPSGKWLGRLDLVFKGVSHLIEGQIIQDHLDFVRVLIVPGTDFTDNDEQILSKKLHERLGSEIKIAIEKVESIPRTKQGKYQLVISKVH